MRVSVFIGIALVALAGCSHNLHGDFSTYLYQHPGTLEKIDAKTGYTIERGTQEYVYEYNTASTATAVRWVVNVGDMLKDYLNGYVRDSFQSFEYDPDRLKYPLNIEFNVLSYKIESFRAMVEMRIVVHERDVLVLDKKYSAQGQTQPGKMVFGTVFSQRLAVHQSTQYAFDAIMKSFLSDVKGFVSAMPQ